MKKQLTDHIIAAFGQNTQQDEILTNLSDQKGSWLSKRDTET